MDPDCDVPKVKIDRTVVYYILHIENGESDPILSGVSMNLTVVPVQ